MTRTRRGFTLIELMVVIAVLAVLMAILLPSYLHAKAQGEYSSCKQGISSVAKAFEMYAADNGGQFPLMAPVVIPGYIRTMPTCPSSGRMFTVVTNPPPDATYTLYCPGTNHAALGVGSNYPQYIANQGLVER